MTSREFQNILRPCIIVNRLWLPVVLFGVRSDLSAVLLVLALFESFLVRAVKLWLE